MSFYKQNTWHIHLSDNLWNNVRLYSYEHQQGLYAAFRLWSDDPAVEGLNTRRNESYTREEFDRLQYTCASRGVTILPEIEAPGHALVISQWKPEIALPTDMSLLNISHPDTIPTVKTIWEVFLPWFHTNIEINDFIIAKSGKKTRIWGTFPPRQGGNTDKEVSIQHWAPWEANPRWDFLQNGYKVLNSGDRAYIVGKWSEPYPQELNLDFIFGGNPEGGPFYPNIFDNNNATNNAPLDDPNVLGHIAAQWNDFGPNATTVLEAYYQWKDGIAAVANQQWGSKLSREDYADLYAVLQPHAPGQNLDRRIPSVGPTILDYDFVKGRRCNGKYKDESGNNYHAASTCSNSDEGIILQPGDSELWFGNGTSNAVMLFLGESAYALNYTFPIGEWTEASLAGQGKSTYLDVGEGPMEFLTILGWEGDKNVWTYIGIEAPLRTIGGGSFEGVIGKMKLVDNA
ncbi:hypothetical protein HYQ46_011825 [Verticillium longisporum]|nr:hypothetical protein HYQ46_011825 [Verticillium longisporum]